MPTTTTISAEEVLERFADRELRSITIAWGKLDRLGAKADPAAKAALRERTKRIMEFCERNGLVG